MSWQIPRVPRAKGLFPKLPTATLGKAQEQSLQELHPVLDPYQPGYVGFWPVFNDFRGVKQIILEQITNSIIQHDFEKLASTSLTL